MFSEESISSTFPLSATERTVFIVDHDPAHREMLYYLITSYTPYHALLFDGPEQALEQLALIQQYAPILFLFSDHYPYHLTTALYEQLHTLSEFEAVCTLVLTTDIHFDLSEITEKPHLHILSQPYEVDTLLQTILTCITHTRNNEIVET